MKKRTIVYIDGFNFYYSLKKSTVGGFNWRKYYWIDLIKLFEQYLSPDIHELVKVKYFTAKQSDPGKVARQSIWLSLLKNLYPNRFEPIWGNYKEKTLRCPLDCSYGGRSKNYITNEEKETDVNIAVHMISDCYENLVDNVILVSGDSDQSPPLRLLVDKFPKKKIKVYFPPTQGKFYSGELSRIIQKKDRSYMEYQNKFFEDSLMSDKVSISEKEYFIPKNWKTYQRIEVSK